MASIEDKAVRLKNELAEALNDERYQNLSFVAGGNLTKGCRNYLQQHTEKICRLTCEYGLCLRIQRIINGEIFTLADIDKCRQEIMQQYPEYEKPITAYSGILFAAEAIRKSFGRKYYLLLYKYPILIDFETLNNRICVVHPSNFIEYYSKEERKE